MIGLQVAPAGTEDPEEKPEVCHLTGGDPSENEEESGCITYYQINLFLHSDLGGWKMEGKGKGYTIS